MRGRFLSTKPTTKSVGDQRSHLAILRATQNDSCLQTQTEVRAFVCVYEQCLLLSPPTRQRTYGQLHVDLQHLVTYITSPDSRLSAETRSTLGQLPVCADMKRAFGTLAGEEVEEEDIGMDRSLEFEGELGKLLSQVTILDNIKLNTNDWT